jgi:hypothetical protein
VPGVPQLTRRDLIRWLGAAAALAKLPGCGDNITGDAVFTGAERSLLEKFADVIIPPDDAPGGAQLGAVAYIEGLINAYYGVGPPRIYAGGPFSDRNPLPDGTMPANDFVNFVELDRVNDTAWRLFIFGSAGVTGGAPNEAQLGPVVGLRDRLKQGLDAASALKVADPAKLFDALDDDFRGLLIDLVTEAAFAAPEYGGNPGGAGWQLVHFEGDSLPRGYSQFDGTGYVERPEAPLSTPNPGGDPEPLSDDVKQLLATVVSVLGGRVKA